MMMNVVQEIHRVPEKLFNLAFKNGVWYRGGMMDIKVYDNHGEWPYIAFIVPVSVSKKATIRNMIKRRGRGAIIPLAGRIKKGVIVLVFFRRNIEYLPALDIAKTFSGLAKKAKIFSWV